MVYPRIWDGMGKGKQSANMISREFVAFSACPLDHG